MTEIAFLIIVLIVVVFVLRRENRKSKKYFGKQVDPSRKEKRILEKYKRAYEPIATDERLPQLERDGWTLEDVAYSATEIVYDNPIPAKESREGLNPGDLVKLKFLFDEDGETEVERMWVKVIEKRDGLFRGELDHDPFNEILKAGHPVWFHPNHVFQIDANQR